MMSKNGMTVPKLSKDDNLSELHDCEKCHGKLVSITVDAVGVERCGYCHEVVPYTQWFREKHPEIFVEIDKMREANVVNRYGEFNKRRKNCNKKRR